MESFRVSDRGIVTVTLTQDASDDSAPRCAADLTVDSRCQFGYDSDQWLCEDLRHRMVEVHHYTIRSQFDTRLNDCHLGARVIESSDDGTNRKELD
jgi:hypothetical protein